MPCSEFVYSQVPLRGRVVIRLCRVSDWAHEDCHWGFDGPLFCARRLLWRDVTRGYCVANSGGPAVDMIFRAAGCVSGVPLRRVLRWGNGIIVGG